MEAQRKLLGALLAIRGWGRHVNSYSTPPIPSEVTDAACMNGPGWRGGRRSSDVVSVTFNCSLHTNETCDLILGMFVYQVILVFHYMTQEVLPTELSTRDSQTGRNMFFSLTDSAEIRELRNLVNSKNFSASLFVLCYRQLDLDLRDAISQLGISDMSLCLLIFDMVAPQKNEIPL